MTVRDLIQILQTMPQNYDMEILAHQFDPNDVYFTKRIEVNKLDNYKAVVIREHTEDHGVGEG